MTALISQEYRYGNVPHSEDNHDVEMTNVIEAKGGQSQPFSSAMRAASTRL
jgi:hypothetical protein